MIERHHIGHRAQRHQIEQAAQIRLGQAACKTAARAQIGAQSHQHIKNHPHAGQIFALKAAAGLVGVDNDAVGHGVGGQVVVGDDHLQPQGLRPRHAGEAGNAVVHREQNLRAARRSHVGQLGREAVAVLEAVGHQKIHRRAHALQAFHAHGAGGGAIGIVIGHNQNVFPRQHRIGQPRGRFGAAFEALVRQKAGELVLQFGRRCHGACGTQARQQRVGAGGNQALAGVGVVGAGLDFGRHGVQMRRERRYCNAKRRPGVCPPFILRQVLA